MIDKILLDEFDHFLKSYLQMRKKEIQRPELQGLFDSIEYTLLASGKRFRPSLVFSYCQALNIDYKKSMPLSSAIEMIHTASLIHDDLPCMDNDSSRRGNPSNHLAFGEDIALLSGDSLFIEAFYLLAYYKQPILMIQRLAQASSVLGMMGGQFLDLKSAHSNKDDIQTIHQMKTGAMIQVCLEGVLPLAEELSEKQEESLRLYSDTLSELFQLADDLQDKDSKEQVSILHYLTEEELRNDLKQKTDQCVQSVEIFGTQSDSLKKLALFNLNRVL